MQQYLDLMAEILANGERKSDRTGTGALSLFGRQLRFNLQYRFPVLTTKRVFFRGVVEELLWFLRGEDNIRSLKAQDVHIWDEWAKEDGYVGPVYGWQWRKWGAVEEGPDHFSRQTQGIDQIAQVIHSLKTNPDSRRHIISAWNVADVPRMALPPCHLMAQFYVSAEQSIPIPSIHHRRKLSCHMYQRSADFFLGVPFNIASYALLTHMIAQVCNYAVGELIISFGDVHLYLNHLDQVKEQLSREPKILQRPRLLLSPAVTDIDKFASNDILLDGYDPYPAIKAPISV